MSSMCAVARGSCVGGRQPSQRGVLGERRDLALGQRGGLDALLGGAPDDLVVDVGDVAHEGDVDAAARR